jgi:hypothetical protein
MTLGNKAFNSNNFCLWLSKRLSSARIILVNFCRENLFLIQMFSLVAFNVCVVAFVTTVIISSVGSIRPEGTYTHTYGTYIGRLRTYSKGISGQVISRVPTNAIHHFLLCLNFVSYSLTESH